MGPGSHVGFQMSTKNTNIVEDHPMNISEILKIFYEHFWQVWLKSVQRFQRRFKCEKLTDGRTDGQTDGRTLTHDKSSPGLWLLKLHVAPNNGGRHFSELFNVRRQKA
jgi:hypothetical protein